MSIGLIGKKVGMTRVFNEDGSATAVTVIDVSDNVFLQRKTQEKDGYTAVQVGYGDQKESRINQAAQGHIKAHGGTPKRKVIEFRLDSDEQLPECDHPGVELFEKDQWVDIIGTSKGKGFQGVVKRHGFAGVGQATHGQHNRLRAPGSIGAASTPARVFKGMRMAGQMGNSRVTIENLEILKVLPEEGLLVVKGAVPGHKGASVIIRKPEAS